jgi:hypothetical protein
VATRRIDSRIEWLRASLIAALCGSGIAIADDTPATATTAEATPAVLLQSFIGDTRVKQSMQQVAAHSTVMTQSKCTDMKYEADSKYEIVTPPTFDASGNPTSGAWKQVVNESGCNATHVLNVFVEMKDGSLTAAPLLPGATRLDPIAQKEGIDKAVTAANEVPHSGDSDCRSGFVADTEFVEDTTAKSKNANGPEWTEKWTLISCRRKFLVPMRFKISDKGIHIFAGPAPLVKFISLGGSGEFAAGGQLFEPGQTFR